jgi:AcrR family transcriptional regulator
VTDPYVLREPVQRRSRAAVKSILQATHYLLNTEPYDQISMQAVSRRSGVSVGSIYRYYADKADLIRAAQEETLRKLEMTCVSRLVDAAPAVDAIMSALVSAFRDLMAESAHELLRFMTSGIADPVLRSRAETTRHTIFVTLHAALERDRIHVAHEDLERATRFAQEIVVWLFFFQSASAETQEEPAVDLDAVAREARRASVVYLTQPFDYLGTDARGTDHD